jgi:uncharacterized protein YcbX
MTVAVQTSTQLMLIKELWRYPVKSMAGEQLDTAEITEHGIVGDRIIQVRNAAGRLFSARTRPGASCGTRLSWQRMATCWWTGVPGTQEMSLSMLRKQQAREPAWSAAMQRIVSMCAHCWS